MTTQESFKRRIRARMAKTGERYAAARRALIDQAGPHAATETSSVADTTGRDGETEAAGGRARPWAAEPETSDAAVTSATGRSWDQWVDAIEGWPGRAEGHTVVAGHLQAEHGLDGWWAQTVTVGWERITGRRLPHQRPDGTFTASRSRTVTVDASMLRRMLLDDEARAELFPGLAGELRSRPTAKAIRVAVGPGVARITLTPTDGGGTTITVAHERIPTYGEVEEWKRYWGEWFDAVVDASP
jgi:hypothetical protein